MRRFAAWMVVIATVVAVVPCASMSTAAAAIAARPAGGAEHACCPAQTPSPSRDRPRSADAVLCCHANLIGEPTGAAIGTAPVPCAAPQAVLVAATCARLVSAPRRSSFVRDALAPPGGVPLFLRLETLLV